jgi:hypothetical protein
VKGSKGETSKRLETSRKAEGCLRKIEKASTRSMMWHDVASQGRVRAVLESVVGALRILE